MYFFKTRPYLCIAVPDVSSSQGERIGNLFFSFRCRERENGKWKRGMNDTEAKKNLS